MGQFLLAADNNINPKVLNPPKIFVDDFSARHGRTGIPVNKNAPNTIIIAPKATSSDGAANTYDIHIRLYGVRTEPSTSDFNPYNKLIWRASGEGITSPRLTVSSPQNIVVTLTDEDFEDGLGNAVGEVRFDLKGDYCDGETGNRARFKFLVQMGCESCSGGVCNAGSMTLGGTGGGGGTSAELAHSINLGVGLDGQQTGSLTIDPVGLSSPLGLDLERVARAAYEPYGLGFSVGEGFEVIPDHEVSGAEFLSANSLLSSTSEIQGGSPGTLYLDVENVTPGDYTLWLLVDAPSENANSLFVSVDDSLDVDLNLGSGAGKRWVSFQSSILSGLSGSHRIALQYREAGFVISDLFLTQDSAYTPVNLTTYSYPNDVVPLLDGYVYPNTSYDYDGENLLDLTTVLTNETSMNPADDSTWIMDGTILALDRSKIDISDIATGYVPEISNIYLDAEQRYIWVRVKAPDYNSNRFQFFLGSDFVGSPDVTFSIVPEPFEDWQWVRYERPVTSTSFQQENFSLYVFSFDSGGSIDKFIITEDSNFIPVGTGVGQSSVGTTTHIEAETAVYYENFGLYTVIEGDSTASGDEYLQNIETNLTYLASPDSNDAEYTLDIPLPGEYLLWVRMRAESAADNELWVTLDDQTRLLSATPDFSWQWVKLEATSFDLAAGEIPFKFTHKDSGVLVDKFMLVTDSAFIPLDKESVPSLGSHLVCEAELVENSSVAFSTRSSIRQILSGEALIDIFESDFSPHYYDIKFYSYSSIGETDANGYYQTNGNPYSRYAVYSSGSSQRNFLTLWSSDSGQSEYEWDEEDKRWWLRKPTAKLCGVRDRFLIEGFQHRTLLSQIFDTQDNLISESLDIYKEFTFGEALYQRIVDPDGEALTTELGYYESGAIPEDLEGGYEGALKYSIQPDGYWEIYEYDDEHRISKTISQYLNSEFGDEANSRIVEYTYTPLSETANYSKAVVETIKGVEVSRRYSFSEYSASHNEFTDIICQTPGARVYSSDNLITVTKKIPYGFDFARKTLSVERPDGTMTLYDYERIDDQGNLATEEDYTAIRTTSYTGVPNAEKTAVVKGTQNINVLHVKSSVTTSTRSFDIETQSLLAASDVLEIDEFNRVTLKGYLDGTTEQWSYNCCNLEWHIDRKGIQTSYTYDDNDRRETTTRLGVTTKTVYDAQGRVVQQLRKSENESDTAYVVLSESEYNIAGQQTYSRQLASDGSFSETAYAYDYYPQSLGIPGMSTTMIYEDLGTQISVWYGDGKQLETTGTSVASPMRMSYSVDSANNTEVIRRTALNSNGTETSEWSESHQIMGRNIKTKFADGSSSENFYDDIGRIEKSLDPDGVAMLYQYNEEGERYRTILDVDGDGVLTLPSDLASSPDRITENERLIATRDYDGVTYTVNRSLSKVWTDSGLVTTAINDRSLDGRRSWSERFGQIAYTESIGTDTSDGTWSVKSIQPDEAYTVQTFTNGRMSSAISYDADGAQLASTSILYDALGRQEFVTDSRTGTTQLTYYDNDSLASTIAPDPDAAGPLDVLETTYFYDNMGRRTRVMLPDATSTYTSYNLKGQVEKTYGALQNPVEYTYDYAGRQKTMTTWQDFDEVAGTGVSGSADTTWFYNPQRGWLDRKEYDDGNGTDYTYTDGGRLASRTWARDADPMTAGHQDLVTNYAYNSAGDLLGVDYSDSTADIHYTYTRTGQQDIVSEGQFATAAFAAGQVFTPALAPTLATTVRSADYEHNDRFQVESETLSGLLSSNVVLTRDYENGTETNGLIGRDKGYSLSAASTNSAVNYAYDSAGRLETITQGSDSFTYEYVPSTVNLLASMTAPVHTVTYTYEPGRNAMTGIENEETVGTASVVSDYAYSYNTLGQRESREQSGSAFSSTNEDTFYYDYLGQIDYVENDVHDGIAKYEPNYSFDEIGNRTGNTVDLNGTTNYTQDLLNQYTAVGSTSPVYDDDGNLTSDGVWTYTWNGENRLTCASDGTKSINFLYDYQGRLVEKDDGANVEVYVYDGWNRIYKQTTNNQQPTTSTRYLWGLDLSGSMQRAGGVGGLLKENSLYPTYDANGNIVQKLNTSGGADMAVEYDPFGNVISGTLVGEYGFSTKPLVEGINLYYYGFRYYDPETGRWPSRDPIEEAGGYHLYGFAFNNGIDNWDYLGQAIETGWDVFNVGTGVISLAANVSTGNIVGVAIDVGGLSYDLLATAVPGLPGGASSAIKAGRLSGRIGDVVYKSWRISKNWRARRMFRNIDHSDQISGIRYAVRVGIDEAHHIIPRNGPSLKFGRALRNQMDCLRERLKAAHIDLDDLNNLVSLSRKGFHRGSGRRNGGNTLQRAYYEKIVAEFDGVTSASEFRAILKDVAEWTLRQDGKL